MLQLFLQQRDGEVSLEEQKIMENWVARDSLRLKSYNVFADLILFKKRVVNAAGHDVRLVLTDIQGKFPMPFGDIDVNATEYTIRAALLSTLDQAMFNMARLIVFGFKRITVTILFMRLGILLLAIFIIWEMLKSH